MLIDDMFLDLGYGYKVALREVYAMFPMNLAPVKEMYREYWRQGKVYRATKGRKAKSFLLLQNGWTFVSALSTDELNERIWEMRRIRKAKESLMEVSTDA